MYYLIIAAIFSLIYVMVFFFINTCYFNISRQLLYSRQVEKVAFHNKLLEYAFLKYIFIKYI